MGTRACADGESTHYEASVRVVRAPSCCSGGALVPRKRLGSLPESRARGAPGNAVEDMHSEGRPHAQLKGIPRARKELISIREPAQRERGGQAGHRLLDAGGGRKRCGHVLQSEEFAAVVDVRGPPDPEALIAGRLTRDVQRADGAEEAVEGQDLEPWDSCAERGLVPRRQLRQLLAAGNREGKLEAAELRRRASKRIRCGEKLGRSPLGLGHRFQRRLRQNSMLL